MNDAAAQLPLAGKTVLVTGASRGLGLAIAREVARRGANVCMVARDHGALTAHAPEFAELCDGRGWDMSAADLTVEDQRNALLSDLAHRFGTIDVLVNNAAVQGPIGPFESIDIDAWRRVFELDFFVPADLAQRLIPAMRRAGWGKIINLSGGGATGPRPDFSAYACAKTALIRLTETLAEELRGSGIDVNAVAPGAMNTRMLDETLAAGPAAAPREYEAALKRSKEGGAPPEKGAELVAWLASPASDGITGRLLSAVWDDWRGLPARREALAKGDVYTLRRIVPKDRGLDW